MVFKKLAAGLACICMVLFSVVPVYAGDDAEVPHVHLFESTPTTFSGILTGEYDEGTHIVIRMRMYKCDCGVERAIEDSRTREAHSPHFTSMSNNHTSPGLHDFWGTCACGYTTMISVYCPGGNNHVSAPN